MIKTRTYPRFTSPCTLCVLSQAFLFLVLCSFARAESSYVQTNSAPGSFPLFEKTTAQILIASNDWPGVLRAGNDLAGDLQRVTGIRPLVATQAFATGKYAVIIGTIGRSELIDRLAREKKIKTDDIAGKWESFLVQVVADPLPGIESALVICGSDKRGTIYGIYDLSEKTGVSPWHYWSDTPARKQEQLFIRPGRFVTGPPSVKYRGIFLKDRKSVV